MQYCSVSTLIKGRAEILTIFIKFLSNINYMIEVVLLIIGLIAGFLAGWYFGISSAYQKADLSNQLGTIQGLTTQIAEMKGKFVEIERSREKLEKEREKLDQEKEKRFKEFIEHNQKTFKELKESSNKSDEEKEKRIKEIIERNEKFFEEQKKNTEKFLEQHGKSREEIEKQRDAQIADMKKTVQMVSRTFAGTKTSGIAAEAFLKQALENSIKAKVVKCDLKTDNGEVEFAWNLGDGKFIPIDSKFPDVLASLKEYDASEDEIYRKQVKKAIVDKSKKEVERIKKYQNLSNTIDSCIIVFPEGILEIALELVGIGASANVFVCSYRDVFPIAHMLQDQYIRMKGEGDIGQYKAFVKSLFQILEKIAKKTDAIEKAVITIKNANDNIKDEIVKGKRQEYKS